MKNPSPRDRFLGCLLGGAAGDALGAPVEFMRRAAILEEYGPGGIQEFSPAFGVLGAITDDTQMALFTAEGLLRAYMRHHSRGICCPESVVANAYLRWLLTQGERPGVRNWTAEELGKGWLFGQRNLHSRRAPGNTCLSALKALKDNGDRAHNGSKGCGGVMRMAPVGLFLWNEGGPQRPAEAFRMGADLAALTHGHPTSILASGALAALVVQLVDGTPLPEALAAVLTLLPKAKELDYQRADTAAWPADAHQETLRSLKEAGRLAVQEGPSPEAVARLGEGWVAEEALAIAVYCALAGGGLREGVTLAVSHDGDSDSTGAVAGNLLGAMHGEGAIPPSWLGLLELRGVIAEVADDLYGWRHWEMDQHGEYPMWRYEKYPPG